MRLAKNYTKGYTDTQACCLFPSERPPRLMFHQTKVRDSTSNDPWGPSGTQMNEIAQLTYDQWAILY